MLLLPSSSLNNAFYIFSNKYSSFSPSVIDHQTQVQQLHDKIIELETEKKEFGVQRAKMKSLMLQNEGKCCDLFIKMYTSNLKIFFYDTYILLWLCITCMILTFEYFLYLAEKVRLQSELEELRRQLAVMDLNSKNYVEEEKRKFDEQIASLEHLLHGNYFVNQSFISKVNMFFFKADDFLSDYSH